MWVRGAPLIGVTAAYGVASPCASDPCDAALDAAWETPARDAADGDQPALGARRDARASCAPLPPAERARRRLRARRRDRRRGRRAQPRHRRATASTIIQQIAARKKPGEPVNILTHCNAGWLATVDYGTATAPIYLAIEAGIPVHVCVDETRPRNQGAQLTAWELASHGVPHTLIVDNAGGHLMQHGQVDMVIVGTDRTTANGDVCNKIGTYLKALAARDNDVPFYVAPALADHRLDGPRRREGNPDRGALAPTRSSLVQGRDRRRRRSRGCASRRRRRPAANPAFDVTPARLVTGLITERGVAKASREGLKALFPERG